MIRVATGSRLHFGLFRAGAPGPDGRRFGGAGLMVEEPGISLVAEPAAEWSASGPLAGRALAFARRFADGLPAGTVAPHHVTVERAAPEHAGLGTGTQLGLAVARALALSAGLDCATAELARRVGRGGRSAVGVHGFEYGGLIVEAGKRDGEDLAPLLARADFPSEWRVVLVRPAVGPGLHSAPERDAFEQLAAQRDEHADALIRLALGGMIPAAAARDLISFGRALDEYNALAGSAFAAAQGGVYAGPLAAELVAFLRAAGGRGVGQSSWGPTVFAVAADADRAAELARRAADRFGEVLAEVRVTAGRPAGHAAA